MSSLVVPSWSSSLDVLGANALSEPFSAMGGTGLEHLTGRYAPPCAEAHSSEKRAAFAALSSSWPRFSARSRTTAHVGEKGSRGPNVVQASAAEDAGRVTSRGPLRVVGRMLALVFAYVVLVVVGCAVHDFVSLLEAAAP